VNPGQFFGRQSIEVLIQRQTGVYLVPDSIQSGHQHGGITEIRIHGTITRTELKSHHTGIALVPGDSYTRSAVGNRIGSTHRRFKTRNQPLERVRGRVRKGQEGIDMFQHPTNVKTTQFGEPGRS